MNGELNTNRQFQKVLSFPVVAHEKFMQICIHIKSLRKIAFAEFAKIQAEYKKLMLLLPESERAFIKSTSYTMQPCTNLSI